MTQNKSSQLYSLDAEAIVLAYMLTVKDPMSVLYDINLTYEDFYNPLHESIYYYLYAQFKNQYRRANTFQLYSQLENNQNFQESGGRKYIEQLRDAYQGKTRAIEAGEEVKELSRRRQTIEVSQQVYYRTQNLSENLNDIQADLAESLNKNLSVQTNSKPDTAQDIIHRYFDYLDQIANQPDDYNITTPYPDLEKYTCGFAPGEMVILAARPGCGKTALAVNIGVHTAEQNKATGIFSLEMSQESLCNRIFSSMTDIPLSRFRNGQFSDSEWKSLYKYADQFKKLPLLIHDCAKLKPTQFREKCRIWQQQHNVRLIILDYLQLMDTERHKDKREREVAEASRIIKQTAIELQIPVLVLCQLNREADKTGKPLMSQLRESGAIEQDADIILFIHAWQQDPEQKNVAINMSIGKGRNNATGNFQLLFQKKVTKFLSYQQI